MIDLLPAKFHLSQNYPNPFEERTAIKYCVPRTCKVTVTIYDLQGRVLEKLVDEEKPPGTYEVIWNAGDIPCGMYSCVMEAGSFLERKTMEVARVNW